MQKPCKGANISQRTKHCAAVVKKLSKWHTKGVGQVMSFQLHDRNSNSSTALFMRQLIVSINRI